MSDPSTTNVRVANGEPVVTNLAGITLQGASGVVWGLDSPHLNANLVTIRAGDSIQQHTNTEVDVLLIVISGAGEVVLDGIPAAVSADSIVLIPRNAARSIRSAEGMAYYSIHTRRPGPSISSSA